MYLIIFDDIINMQWCRSDKRVTIVVTLLVLIASVCCKERVDHETCSAIRWSFQGIEAQSRSHGRTSASSGQIQNGNDALPGSLATRLEGYCFHPEGTGCEWYSKCLEKRYPCGDSPHPYASKYAQPACENYYERSDFFSSEGQQWFKTASYCLKTDLVPYLYKSAGSLTCKELQDFAFASHARCYVHPGRNLSVCTLGLLDWAQVFWTLKGYVFTPGAFFTIFEIIIGCISIWL